MLPSDKRVFSLQSSVFSLIAFSLILLTTCYLLLATPVKAADLSSVNFNYLINGQTTIEGSIFHSFFCMIIGLSPLNQCAGFQASNGQPATRSDAGSSTAEGSNFAKIVVLDRLPSGGALGSTGGLIAGLYDSPPISSTYYLAHIGQDFGLIPSAYAQQQTNILGPGAGVLDPIYRLWQVMRNLSYAAFIIVIIVIGFMIMLRQRINPQTVVTIQQAIPSVIIGLALVTISYFIASLILDLAFIGTDLVITIFGWSGLNNTFGDPAGLRNLAQNANFWEFFKTATFNGGIGGLGTVFSGVQDQILDSFGFLGGSVIPGILGVIGGGLAFGMPGAIFGGIGGAAAGPAIIPLLIIIILIFALLIQVVRLAFSLISAYIELLVLTIAGPIYILWGSIPGRGGTINYWIRGLLANSLIFPAVFAGFIFAGIVLGSDFLTASSGPSLFTAYAQGSGTTNPVTLPLFGGLSGQFIKVLIAYGILMGLPAIPGMVKEAFKYKGPAGISGEAVQGVNAGILAGRSTYVGGGALNQLAYEKGRWNPLLRGAGNANWLPMPIRSRIPKPTIPASNPPAGAPRP